MPGVDMPLEKLKDYMGGELPPKDFLKFWKKASERVKSHKIMVKEKPVSFKNDTVSYMELEILSLDGCQLSAKYIYPENKKNFPLVIQFHDYPETSRSWFHLSRYASIGCGVLAPNCRGQGGKSGIATEKDSPIAYGPLFQGLEGCTENLYLFRLIEDALLWVEVAKSYLSVENSPLIVYGEGQGGGLALACAAMNPEISKCGVHYPMLCDYRRVWEMDFDKNGYEGLKYYFKWQDPEHKREEDIFRKLAYVDVKNFAPYIQAEVLISTGLQDTISPPSAQFAVVNNMNCPRYHKIYPKHGHELNNFFENEWLKFLLKGRVEK